MKKPAGADAHERARSDARYVCDGGSHGYRPPVRSIDARIVSAHVRGNAARGLRAAVGGGQGVPGALLRRRRRAAARARPRAHGRRLELGRAGAPARLRHRVLVPDLPGHAGSSPLPAAPNMDAYAERVWGLARAEDMLPAVVVGHSMGGLVALRLALRHPRTCAGSCSPRRPASSRRRVAPASGSVSSSASAQACWSRRSHAPPSAPARSARCSSARSRPRIPLALTPRAVRGFLGSSLLHADVISAVRALVVDDPRFDLGRAALPRARRLGRARPAAADRGRLRARAAGSTARSARSPTAGTCSSANGRTPVATPSSRSSPRSPSELPGAGLGRRPPAQAHTGFGSSMNSHATPKRSATSAASA